MKKNREVCSASSIGVQFFTAKAMILTENLDFTTDWHSLFYI